MYEFLGSIHYLIVLGVLAVGFLWAIFKHKSDVKKQGAELSTLKDDVKTLDAGLKGLGKEWTIYQALKEQENEQLKNMADQLNRVASAMAVVIDHLQGLDNPKALQEAKKELRKS